MIRTLLTCLFIFPGAIAVAAELELLNVEKRGKVLQVDSVLVIDAPRALVFAALSDYAAFSQLSDRYKQSRFIEPAEDGTPRIYTEVEGCVLFFCRTITQVQDIRDLGQGYLVISEVEGQSDFSSGYTMWHVINNEQGAQVTIRARLKPDFWIPPFIGPWLFQNKLLEQGEALINKLESLTSE